MQPNHPEPSVDVDRLAALVVDSAIEVHRHLGPGYTESVYEDALAVELEIRSVPFERQVAIQLDYKGHAVGAGRLDLLVGKMLVVELKAVDALLRVHSAQVIAYLKMTRLPLGLLMNFNSSLMKDGIKRIILSPSSLASWRLGGENSEAPHGE